ncbi:hypothetical protein, partial [Klebsiella pneumoniae]|uniref:hypothetical protein n=1 Tax=Klebsiella pneumoniae TaxID=573 RepID=UPI00371318D1
MTQRKPRAAELVTEHPPAIASALRTLDAEASGITALAAALQNGLGAPFAAAVELIRNARGRVIVS